MKPFTRLTLSLLVCLFSHVIAHGQTLCAASAPVACPTPPPMASPKPACPQAKDITGKWQLWSAGTCLRGANVWQKRVTCKHGMGEGPVGPPYGQEDFELLAKWGANYVNISHPGILGEQPSYPLDEAVFQNLERLITFAERADLLVVVSFRTGPLRNEAVFGGEDDQVVKDVWECEDARRETWVRMWVETARRIKSRASIVGYDLMVEPDTADHALWNGMAATVAAEIRKVDPETPIIIGAADWSHVSSLDGLVPNGVPRTVYAVHQYAPSDYTHQEKKDGGFKKGDPKKLAAELDRVYRRVGEFRATHGGLPMVVNEFGVFRWAPNADCFMRYQFELLERAGLNHALWLWETSSPLVTYDQFNFRRGPNPKNKQDCATSGLIEAIKANWRLNTVRLKDVRDKLAVP